MIYSALSRSSAAFAAQMQHMYGSGSTWNHMATGPYGDVMNTYGWLFLLLFIVAVGVILFLVLRRNDNGRRHNALEVLKIRFARGEISREEFEEKLNLLR